MSKKTPAEIAALLDGTPTRYQAPKCYSWVDTGEMVIRYEGATPTPKQEWVGVPTDQCGHAPDHHAGGLTIGNGSGGYFGLRRNKAGAFEYSKPAKLPENGRPLSTTMLQNIAACAAFGLSYWSDAPGAGNVYAVDEWQQAHVLKIDRKASKVEGDYDGRDAYGYRVRYRYESFEVQSTQQLLFAS